jgi:hypothetical protein
VGEVTAAIELAVKGCWRFNIIAEANHSFNVADRGPVNQMLIVQGKRIDYSNVLNIRETLIFHHHERNITVGRMATSPGIHQRRDILGEIYPSTVPQHRRLYALQGEISFI